MVAGAAVVRDVVAVVVVDDGLAVTDVRLEWLVVVRLVAVRLVAAAVVRLLVAVVGVGVVVVATVTLGVLALAAAVELLLAPPPPQAASASAARTPGAIAASLRAPVIPGCDGCHSQSSLVADIVRSDGRESDGL